MTLRPHASCATTRRIAVRRWCRRAVPAIGTPRAGSRTDGTHARSRTASTCAHARLMRAFSAIGRLATALPALQTP